MASQDNLLISFNFDNVTGSNASGEIFPNDLVSDEAIKGIKFDANDSLFVLKENLLTNKLLQTEIIDGSETISVREDDEINISPFGKPSSVRLIIENSMYQAISDEMLNLFSTINAYASRYTEPANKYKQEQSLKSSLKLKDLRKFFYSKINNKPDLEKYIEFYKWIDSSLGYMLQQLIPESTNKQNGLKISVESHALERNKYTFPLPLSIRSNKNYNSVITVTNFSSSLSKSVTEPFLTASIEDVIETQNALNKNFSKTHQYFQTAGGFLNNRSSKVNKSVISTRFSSVDGLSEADRLFNNEFSVHNGLNQRLLSQRTNYNTSQSLDRRIDQGASSNNNFEDNAFIQRNVPYTASNYYVTGVAGYVVFPNNELQFRRNNNILIEDSLAFFNTNTVVDNSLVGDTISEPPIENNIPVKHIIKVPSGLQDIEIFSPYYNEINYFSDRFINSSLALKQARGVTNYFLNNITPKNPVNTFFRKINFLSNVTIKRVEILDNVFPRKDLTGLAVTRTKPNYEEVSGSHNILTNNWSDNSYNKNSSFIRSFWKNSLTDRKRTSGHDAFNGIGSFNCLNFSNDAITKDYFLIDRIPDITFDSSTSSLDSPPASASFSRGLLVYYAVDTRFFAYQRSLIIPFQYYSSGSFYDSIYSLDSNSQILTSSGLQFSGSGKYVFKSSVTESSPVVGELAPLPFSEETKFISTVYSARPKPLFIFNNFFGFDISLDANNISTNPKLTASFLINDSYQNELDVNLKPFYNSYTDFFANIKHKSQNYSIVPEYTLEKNSNVIVGRDDYELSILGNEKYDEIGLVSSENDYILDFKKFINPKSNKIKIVLNGVKKLLPYNGFYANQRIPQIVSLFSSSYFGKSLDNTDYEGVSRARRIQTILQPLFAPGILNNSIKAGLAIDYPTFFTASAGKANTPNYSSSARWDEDAQSVNNELNLRIPFEGILTPQNILKNNPTLPSSFTYLKYVNPLLYSLPLNYETYPAYDISKFEEEKPLYRYAINNFISEIPNFFLNKSQLTYFASEPESKFRQVKAGTVYQMKIEIKKSSNFSMFTTGANNFIPVESLFGPPSSYETDPVTSGSLYYPFAPHYFRTGSNLVIAYTASADGVPSLASLQNLNNLTIYEDTSSFSVPTKQFATASYLRRMPVSSSLHLFDSLEEKKLSFDSNTGKPKDAADPQNTSLKWIIKTKFESPLINYANKTPDQGVTTETKTRSFYRDAISNFTSSAEATFITKYSSINGIWNRLGEIPQDRNSVQISISDDGYGDNSLLKICGFKRETKSISQLADRKEISEGVLLLPFATNLSNAQKTSGKFYYSVKEDKYLFTLDKASINKVLLTNDYQKLNIREIKKIVESNDLIDKNNIIIKTIKAMVNYNVPRHLNWLLDSQINPFTMYISEFTHTLTKEELSNIWQGTLPSIGLIPQEQQIVIEHSIFDNLSFFPYGLNDLTTLDIKMKVFKIKKRARNSYQLMRNDVEDYLRFGEQRPENYTDIPWYTYNWPYDYFSLVELLNIQAGEIFESKEYLQSLTSSS